MLKYWVKEFLAVVRELLWRGFGIFLFIVGTSAGVGSLATGDPLVGITIAWWTIMLGVIGAIGYAIATTGKATKDTVAQAARDAVEKAKSEAEKKN
jgi:hypothetical protein